MVLLRMPAYGSSGPYSTYMGNGGTIEPMSGISSLLGYEDDPPITSGVMHTDPFSGAMATAALFIALHHRARTGEGQDIDLSQQETSIGLVADSVMQLLHERLAAVSKGKPSATRWRRTTTIRAGETTPGSLSRSAQTASGLALCDLMGRPELASDERFQDLASRLANVRQLDELGIGLDKASRGGRDHPTRAGEVDTLLSGVQVARDAEPPAA